MSEPRIAAIESGSWPTAKASDGRQKGTGGTPDRGLDAMARAGLLTLPDSVEALRRWPLEVPQGTLFSTEPRAPRSWTTPQAQDHFHTGWEPANANRDLLAVEVLRPETWPTPAARDWRDDGDEAAAQARNSPCLPAAVTLAEWPTPVASTYGSNQGGSNGRVGPMRPSLERMVTLSLWPTPTAKFDAGSRNTPGSKAHPGISLEDAIRGDGGTGRLDPASSNTSGKSLGWSTPSQAMLGGPVERENCASHHKGAGHVGNELLRQTGNRGRLNHKWVAQLMGFPTDWLDATDEPPSKPSATPASRR